tara:strand:+ start:177 stop:431 length:255 start_codon:yes stop_codon:yes gene_type:complete
MIGYISLAILITFISILVWNDVTCTQTKASVTTSLYPVVDKMDYQQAIELKKHIDKLVADLEKGGWTYTKYNITSAIRRRDIDV